MQMLKLEKQMASLWKKFQEQEEYLRAEKRRIFQRSELVQLSLMTQGMKPKLSAHPNTGLTARFSCFQVLPVHTPATPSSSVESSSKVESRKGRNISRNVHHKTAVHWDIEEPEAQASTSREKPQIKIKVSAKRADSASSEEDEEKSPLRRVKVAPKKNGKRSDTLKKLCRKRTLPLTDDVEGSNFIDETCTEKPQNKTEVNLEEVPPVPECQDSATLPMDKDKAPVKMERSRNRRSVLAILRKFSRKRTVAPLEVERPQVLPGTSRETAHATTEVVPKNPDAVPSAGGQGETPVGIEKVATKKRRRSMYYRIS
ncbi:nucleolar and coiled-body phosphoprotein 1-like [Apodemus sylvaticus]|uniref:nucleolar and coiled-body phosphoprotein 1-like n=1 Tax=Apodemus sylvaticus TaxID=10129 RepID=UPI0022445466|nr:nucleolar and coiled-body phosphoprotein 1-like [Apodemus sylvaticus]